MSIEYEGIRVALDKAISKRVEISVKHKALLPHERELYAAGELENITHRGSSAIWLERKCSAPEDPVLVNVYRPMGDIETLYLVEYKQLPDTQPYQAIMQGPAGRVYADKYLTGW